MTSELGPYAMKRHYLSVEIVLFLLIWPHETNVTGAARGPDRGELAGRADSRINIGDFASQQTFQNTFAWAQFTWDFARKEWCVDAQRRDALPGEMIGGCFKTLRQAIVGLLRKPP